MNRKIINTVIIFSILLFLSGIAFQFMTTDSSWNAVSWIAVAVGAISFFLCLKIRSRIRRIQK